MLGFKSFAERTAVEFGPGISAVVGPNGSGKSNLADALRWALGEQGRSLRTRRAEDIIFAGSSSRRAIGMADVTVLIDNADGLLPVEYGEVELGRRLFRSGENEYLLNRQRVRLRDLVELLDAANLADNAFLFIGQGMVDQALALRPEERRPLFEEAAGIRRHERRRRHAEAELSEAAANLERVRDVLAELRPQVRRLAAQAEQQEARRSAGEELAQALVAAARARLLDAMRAQDAERALLDAARRDADAALADLRKAEEESGGLARIIAERAETERQARQAWDAARTRTMELRVTETRLVSELASSERDRQRLTAERRALFERTDDARRAAARPVPDIDPELEEAVRAIRAAEVEERRRLASMRDEGVDAGDHQALARRERSARLAELERLARRATEARASLEERTARAVEAGRRAAASATAAQAAAGVVRQALDHEAASESAFEALRAESGSTDTLVSGAEVHRSRLEAELEGGRASLSALDALLSSGSDERFVRAARARGGRRLTEGLEVETHLRAAVEAALGEAIAAMMVGSDAAIAMGGGASGTLVLEETSRRGGQARASDGARAEAAAAEAGGGRIVDAVRRDPRGAVTRLLERTLWTRDLAAAVAVRSLLPPGWRVATLDGAVLTEDGIVGLGRRDPTLTRQEERASLARTLASLEAASARAEQAHAELTSRGSALRQQLDAARTRLDDARRARRVAEEHERSTARAAEMAAREGSWDEAQRERAARELETIETVHRELRQEADDGRDPRPADDTLRAAIASTEARVAELAPRREALGARLADAARTSAAAEERRRRAEVVLVLEEARLRGIDDGMGRLIAATTDAAVTRQRLAAELAMAVADERRLELALAESLRGGQQQTDALAHAERRQIDARERLRAAEGRSRAAEVAEMQARLRLESIREQLLVELVGLGPDGLAAVVAESGQGAAEPPWNESQDSAAVLGSALEAAMARWSTAPEADASPPGPGRLAGLRRRYHELGASNPFAAEEHAEVRERLATLEAQRADLESAIASTRELIAALSTRIARQFRHTFEALEDAFARRFRQLFDGGEADLALTDPENLSTTGVEITARPPGKKRQPLQMLSGGERALTAVALLMAMLEVRPVPFCVLDEVDAALDEANIGRFSTALRSLAEKIQFIVITHNRGTIEAADALYGVTVGDDAVSRVVSLRLDPVGHPASRGAAIPIAGERSDRALDSVT